MITPFSLHNRRALQICVSGLAAMVVLILSQAGVHAQAPANLTPVDDKAVRSMVDHDKGKVVLLNFFASWCAPCHKEFPDIVKLYEKYKDQGLDVIAVSMNDATEKPDMQAFIKEMNPPFPVYLTSSTDDSAYKAFYDVWNTQDGDTLPMSIIYDRSGKLQHYYPKERNYSQMEQDVAPLLAAK
jgi:thiol-disulfide isomerase/thioredoxin